MAADTSSATTNSLTASASVAIADLSAPAPLPPAAASELAAIAAVVAPPASGSLPTLAAGAANAGAEHRAIRPRLLSRPPILTAVVTRITAAIDKALNRLSALPAGPINEFLSGTLLLVRRALQPLPGSPSPLVGVGATQLTVRNESSQRFEIWAYYNGSTDNPKVQVAALQPGTEWSNTAYNVLAYDHHLEIVVDGVPKARMVVTNRWDGGPYALFWAPTTRYTGQSTVQWGWCSSQCGDDPQAANLVGQAIGMKTGESKWVTFPSAYAIDNRDQPAGTGRTDLNVWIWRGPDIDSGYWNVANTKQFVVAVKQIPGPSVVHKIQNDPHVEVLPFKDTEASYRSFSWWGFNPNAAPAR